MKTLSLLICLVTAIARAQTNEYRMINGVLSDINAAGWVTVTIPEGSALKNSQAFHFDGTIRPQSVSFQIPAIYNFSRPVDAEIFNFPYTPALFRSGQVQTGLQKVLETDILINTAYANNKKLVWEPVYVNGLVLNRKLVLRVWQLRHAATNYDAVGHAVIIPPAPIFDYGLPVTNAPGQ